ncbi:MAG: hypothetical protein O7F71_03235 [Gammaproteobacteria bacterium]|nr:hypothetical protein [Gammaproteobacteria bacterium]
MLQLAAATSSEQIRSRVNTRINWVLEFRGAASYRGAAGDSIHLD